MNVEFSTKRLAKLMNSAAEMKKAYGERMARAIQTRLAVMKNAKRLADLPSTPPCRCHQLKQDRDEQFAVDLVHPYRLLFVVDHDPTPRKEDGGIDRQEVTAVIITGVIDYH